VSELLALGVQLLVCQKALASELELKLKVKSNQAADIQTLKRQGTSSIELIARLALASPIKLISSLDAACVGEIEEISLVTIGRKELVWLHGGRVNTVVVCSPFPDVRDACEAYLQSCFKVLTEFLHHPYTVALDDLLLRCSDLGLDEVFASGFKCSSSLLKELLQESLSLASSLVRVAEPQL
jgi:hypothetical protein